MIWSSGRWLVVSAARVIGPFGLINRLRALLVSIVPLGDRYRREEPPRGRSVLMRAILL
jgi:hypothetical protein